MSRPSLACQAVFLGPALLFVGGAACSSGPPAVAPCDAQMCNTPGVEAGAADGGTAPDASGGTGTDAPGADAPADTATAMGLCPATPVRALTIPDTHNGMVSGTGKVPTARCWGQTPGPDNVFSLKITKTTGVEIHAQLEPVDTVADQTIVVTVRKRCEDGATELACHVQRNKGQGSTVRLVLEPGDYLVVVDTFNLSVDAGPGGGFMYSMTVKEYTFPANALCKGATVVMNGTSLMNQDASMGVDSLSGKCETTATGKVLYYKASVPAGQTITAKSTGRSSLRLLEGCDVTSCWQSAKAGGTGDGAMISWKNPAAVPADVWVALGNNDAAASGSYDITFTIAP